MPTYEYACSKCGHHFDQFQSMRDEPLRKRPKCGKLALKRLIGGGAGLIFKGSGFYITDYRKPGQTRPSEGGESKPADAPKAGGEAKSPVASGTPAKSTPAASESPKK
jgi:putative FmdB family regulatory protein